MTPPNTATVTCCPDCHRVVRRGVLLCVRCRLRRLDELELRRGRSS